MMRPMVISFRKLCLPHIISVPNFALSDYDASEEDASGYEVSGFDATIMKDVCCNHTNLAIFSPSRRRKTTMLGSQSNCQIEQTANLFPTFQS